MRLAAAYPRDNVPESTITLFRSKLSTCDEQGIVETIEAAISSSPRFPTIADLRRDYNALMLRREDSTPELPVGRTPMPDEVREQFRKMQEAFAGRAAEIEA